MDIKEVSITPVDEAEYQEEVISSGKTPLKCYRVIPENIKDYVDVQRLFKASGAVLWDDNPHFEECRYLCEREPMDV